MQLIEIFKEKEPLKQLEADLFNGNLRMSFRNQSGTIFDEGLKSLVESFAIQLEWLEDKPYYPHIVDVLQKFYKDNNKKLNLEKTKILAYPSSFEGIVHTDSNLKDCMTSITFLNTNWNPTWGGEIICYSNDLKVVIGGVTPQFGKTFVFNGRSPHRAIAPLRASSLLRIVLVTKEKE